MSEYIVALVDDNEADRYIHRRYLTSTIRNIKLLEFEDGEDVLHYLLRDGPEGNVDPPGAFPPHIILLDINMPLMDGYEFLETFEQHIDDDERFSTVIILMLSSSSREDDIQQALSRRLVKDYFIKGQVSPEQLADKVRGYIDLFDAQT